MASVGGALAAALLGVEEDTFGGAVSGAEVRAGACRVTGPPAWVVSQLWSCVIAFTAERQAADTLIVHCDQLGLETTRTSRTSTILARRLH